MLTTKPTVRFRVITPALLRMKGVLLFASNTLPDLPAEGLVITSGSDSKHDPQSRHYHGEAVDLRSKTFRDGAARQSFMASLKALLGQQFYIELEDAATKNEHFHIQVRKGHRFDETQP
jgi:hypothetical protein